MSASPKEPIAAIVARVENAHRSAIGTGGDGSKLSAANQKVINQFRNTNAESSRQFRKKGGARRMERAVEGLNSQLGSVRQEVEDVNRRLIAGPGIALRKVGDKVLVSARPAPVSFYGRGRTSAAALAAAATHPWKPTISGTTVNVLGGSFGGVTVATQDVTITGTGTEYIYAEVIATLTATGTFIGSYTLDTVTLEVGSSVPADVLTGTYRLPLMELLAGALVVQMENTSISVFLQDDGTASSQAIAFYSR